MRKDGSRLAIGATLRTVAPTPPQANLFCIAPEKGSAYHESLPKRT